MKYSKATDYALHTMLFLVKTSPKETMSVQRLAESQDVSPTYLSKILTNLVKAGMIESSSGVSGGYKLRSNWADISFLDVIQAIEGTASLFDCSFDHGPQCPVQRIVLKGENKMESYFRDTTLADLAKEIQ